MYYCNSILVSQNCPYAINILYKEKYKTSKNYEWVLYTYTQVMILIFRLSSLTTYTYRLVTYL